MPKTYKLSDDPTYEELQRAVRDRDKGTCKVCGWRWLDEDGTLHAGNTAKHMKAERKKPFEADSMDNLRLVCRNKHKGTR